ncbi:CPBP family intramembrane metalloprotease [Rhodopirellula sp. JC737]|nr:CPBP family intramembrane glutamic endopeptidase [Rhodopirellula sp. JC737]MCC9656131.1 CPBP family intramembrane metalloprotease [Rhodopirellula sp. JC737]
MKLEGLVEQGWMSFGFAQAELAEATEDIAEVTEIGPAELALTMVSLLLLMAFGASMVNWIRLLASGRRPFGMKAFVPVRPRHLPFWSVIYFFVFAGALLFSASLLQGVFLFAGWIDPPAQMADDLLDPQSEPLVATDPLSESADETLPAEPDETSEQPLEVEGPVADETESPAVEAPAISVPQLALSSMGMMSATLITLLLLMLNHRQTISRVGLVPQRGDVWLGFRSALMILPPTMVIMGVVSALQEYSHPVLDALQPEDAEAGPDYAVFGLLFVTTALVTPVVEEFWIRGLLQGGLQRLADWRFERVQQAFAGSPTPADSQTGESTPYAVGVEETDDTFAEEVAAEAEVVTPEAPREMDPSDWTPKAVWPIVIASLVFALMHWGQGLAPIPLFFLSLGLGYLYRQTGSLVPPIIVHFVLNGLTMVMTLIEMSRT